MQHQLVGLRGKVYAAKYKQLYTELEPKITEEFNRLKLASGNKFTPMDLGRIAIAFRLPVKVACEYLEGYKLIPGGTWQKLQYRGFRAKDAGVVWGEGEL